ncbi:hypothetical protein Pint_36019 [Pistacia integerrima]|uniref:Uncharacterized protein n=1 Tax=Pistacia integerrima TaxID=434235 RepID=A0ACC0Y550_9ROSI|nr:hypothetical protein Pint_36019 [Pistacia integerrima]
MIPRFPFSILAISLLLVVASANLDEENSSSEFSYMGLKGPDHWGGLNKSFSPCATGKHQSPVNILTKQTHIDTTLGPLAKNYIPAANATIINLGFVIGVHYEEEIGDLVIKGKKYTFKQMHWHTPAEHQIDGQIFHAELHAVHLADDGSAAVISILYNYGNPDPLVNKVHFPKNFFLLTL